MNVVSTLRREQIRRTITEHYIETGKGSDLREIAARLGISEATVRRYIRDERGFCIEGIDAHGYGRDPDYYPTLNYLRENILVMRANELQKNVDAYLKLRQQSDEPNPTHKKGDKDGP